MGRKRETHIIGHACGNNGIAKNPPNIPYLQGDVIKIVNLRCGYSYANARIREDLHSKCVKQGVIFCLLPFYSNRYPTTKLNKGELRTAEYSGFRCSRTILTTYYNNYSQDFLRLCQNTEPMRIESMDN